MSTREYYLENKEKWRGYYSKKKKEIAAASVIWKKNNREKYLAGARSYYHRNKQKYRDWRRSWAKTARGLFKRYRSDAKKRKYPFELTFDQFESFWNLNCHYCDLQVVGVGLDREDNSKGYFIGNVVPCCKRCNRMKTDMGKEEFISQANRIAAVAILNKALTSKHISFTI